MSARKPLALCLISGGLDSILAALTMRDLGFEIQGVSFVMSFASRSLDAFRHHVQEVCEEADVPLMIEDIAEEYLHNVLRNPKHGYGKNMNPCIDCKIFMLSKAKELMDRVGGVCLVTGEVLGQRPMSQRAAALQIIREESGVEDILIRPLCGSLYHGPPVKAEREGYVDRKELLAIKGRSRKPQLELAKKYGLTKYGSPAGGCLLTDPGFAGRLRELFTVEPNSSLNDIELLKYGRHFRLKDGISKVVVGRDKEDNEGVLRQRREGDAVLELRNQTGPTVLLRGNICQETTCEAANLCVTHSKSRTESDEEKRNVKIQKGESGDMEDIIGWSVERELIDKLRI